MQLTKKQNEYIRNANARWNLKIGAVRSGKSYVDIAFVILDRITALKDKQGLNVILGVSKETIERNVLQPMREIYTSEIVGEIDSRNKVKIAGIPVYCLGAEKKSQIAKILGSSIKYCYGDEIAKWSKGVFDILKSRLDKPYSCFDGSCNPEYPSHWLKEFIDNPNINSYVQKYTLFDNPTLSQEFVDNLCTEYEGTVFYKRLVLGEWAIAEGLIYPHYEKALKEPPKDENGNIKKAERYVLSIDYGTMNAFACLLWGRYGNVWYALDGYYYSGREKGVTLTDEEYADEIQKQFGDYGNIKTIIDPSAASMIACLRKRGYSIVKADNDVMNGIQETGTAIHKDRIKINPAIKEWKQEAAGYAWDETADDRPIKVNDHYMDATRYFVKTAKVNAERKEYKSIW